MRLYSEFSHIYPSDGEKCGFFGLFSFVIRLRLKLAQLKVVLLNQAMHRILAYL